MTYLEAKHHTAYLTWTAALKNQIFTFVGTVMVVCTVDVYIYISLAPKGLKPLFFLDATNLGEVLIDSNMRSLSYGMCIIFVAAELR